MRTGKIVRYYEHLTDSQLVELARRVSLALVGTHDIDPERIRGALISFAEGMPAC